MYSVEAAKSISNFIDNNHYGIYNVSLDAISEMGLIKLFCNYYNFKMDSLLSSSIEPTNTPFTSNFDFIVDNNKYSSIFPINIEFENALNRELLKNSDK